MHQVLGAGNVAGRYVAGDPQTGQRPTALDRRDFNTLFAELENLVLASGLSLNTLDDTQVTQAVLSLTGGRRMLRNLLVNGDFRLWQRGESRSSSSGVDAFGPDRWFLNNADGATNFSCHPDTWYMGGAALASFNPPVTPRFRYAATWGSSVTQPVVVGQRIEDVRTLGGQTATLSFWACVRVTTGSYSATADIQPKLRQFHGTGGSPAADVTINGPTFALTTIWQKFTWTVAVPLPGAIGTDGWPTTPNAGAIGENDIKSFLELRLELSNWTGTPPNAVDLLLAHVQLEAGAFASDFERRPFGFELSLAQRFYEKSIGFANPLPGLVAPNYLGASMAQGSGTVAAGLNTRFKIPKARVPTIKWFSPVTGNQDTINWNSVEKTVDATLYTSHESTGMPQVTGSSTNTPVYGHWTADAEF